MWSALPEPCASNRLVSVQNHFVLRFEFDDLEGVGLHPPRMARPAFGKAFGHIGRSPGLDVGGHQLLVEEPKTGRLDPLLVADPELLASFRHWRPKRDADLFAGDNDREHQARTRRYPPFS